MLFLTIAIFLNLFLLIFLRYGFIRINKAKTDLLREAEQGYRRAISGFESLKNENTLLEKDYARIFNLYEITKGLNKILDEKKILLLFKEELNKHKIGFQDLRVLIHRPVGHREDIMNIALREPNRVIGYLHIKGASQDFKNDFTILAEQLALGIRRARLYEELQRLAITDGLTGLYTKRHCLARIEEESIRAQKYNLAFAILMADVDHFKDCNDRYSHLLGDIVLKEISKIMKSCLRTIDLVSRFGGEEFLIFMPDTDRKGAEFAAERMRREIASSKIKAYDEILSTSISIGVSCYPQDAKDISDLIDRADKALYEAKNKGRNRVCFYETSQNK